MNSECGIRNAEFIKQDRIKTKTRRNCFLFLSRIPHSAFRILFRLLSVVILYLALGLLIVAPASAQWSVADTLRDYVKANYPWTDVAVEDVRLAAVPPSQAPQSISVVKAPPGKAVFRLVFPGGRTLSASAVVKTYDRVFMSRGSFSKGYTLRPDDYYSTLMESGRIPKDALRDEDRLAGKALSRSIVANATMTEAMITERAVVKRGRRVMLCAEAENFSIKVVGETKQEAAVGEDVKVLNTLSKKIVIGRLIDENTVKVEY